MSASRIPTTSVKSTGLSSLLKSFKNLFASPARQPARSGGFRPQAEQLEDRVCTTVNLGSDAARSLLIQGSGTSGDVVQIVQVDSINLLQVRTAGAVYNLQSSAYDRVVVRLGDGNDNFLYNALGTVSYGKLLNVNLGGGNNVADVNLAYGNINAPLTQVQANMTVILCGQGGADTVTAEFGDLGKVVNPLNGIVFSGGRLVRVPPQTVRVDFYADLGAGNDSLAARFFGDVRNQTTANVVAFGEGGNDLLTAKTFRSPTRNTNSTIAAGGALNVYLDGGAGDDTLAFALATRVQGALVCDAVGGAGNDQIFEYLEAFSGTGSVSNYLSGGLGDDQFHMANRLSNPGGPQLAHLDVTVDGGVGYDTIGLAHNSVTITTQVNVERVFSEPYFQIP
jgi:hypothetical protein